jgi:nitrogenase molybdenum-cofactor synthesis protein NifE
VAAALEIATGNELQEIPSLPVLPRKRIAIIGGPTRAIAMTAFLKELGIEPALIVLDFDTGTEMRLREMAGCEILVEPDQNLVIQKLREKQVDLIMGGMLERSIAAMLDIEHFDMMHGSQKTVGSEGMKILLQVLKGTRQR